MQVIDESRPLPRDTAARIAGAFLPDWALGNRYHYYYARTKLGSDPLYPGVIDALAGSRAPLLDLGCGLGLLAHALHDAGIHVPYHGVDNDAGKIVSARRAAARKGLPDARFDTVDLEHATPDHRGSVAILDMLQFLDPPRQLDLIGTAIDMLGDEGRLVIRTGLEDGSQRGRITRRADVLARVLGWMNAAPRHYPDPDRLRALFEARGLHSTFSPLSGNTPFNNWRIVAQRR